jgi:hypothetical protein
MEFKMLVTGDFKYNEYITKAVSDNRLCIVEY